MNIRDLGAHVIVLADASHIIREHFERNGWVVQQCWSLQSTRQVLWTTDWDLAVLSRDLPDGDAISLCSELRTAWPHRYVVIISDSAVEKQKVAAFTCGADDYLSRPFGVEELTARVRAGLRIVDLQKALLVSNRNLEELALTDHLTALRNRRAFDRELTSRFAAAKRYERPLSLAIIDIDHFKSVNDLLGHAAGDVVLRTTAQILERSTRQSDLLARIGGEEFAVILPEVSLSDAIQYGEKICAAVSTVIRAGEETRNLTVSIGVASIPHSEFESSAELMFAADQALFRAKRNGRNRSEGENRRERGRFATRTCAPVFEMHQPLFEGGTSH